MTSAMPAWLEQQIADRTGVVPGTRSVHHARCRTCRAHVLVGLSDDVLAYTAEVDPTPLGVVGEALALLAGRRTFALRRHLAGHRLYQRDRWQVRGHRGPLRVDLVAEHACGLQLPGVPSCFPPRAGPGDLDAPPPF